MTIYDRVREDKECFMMSKKDNVLMCLFIGIGYLVFCSVLPSVLASMLSGLFPEFARANYVLLNFLTGILYVLVLYRVFGEKLELTKNLCGDGVMEALLIGFAVFVAVNFFLSPFLGSIFTESMGNYSETVDYMYETPVVTFLQVVVVAPLLEEMIFRGFLLKRALRWRPQIAAVLLVAVLFGLLHLNVVQSLCAAAAGLVFCLFYAKRESIGLSILAHSVYNGMAFLLILLFGGLA